MDERSFTVSGKASAAAQLAPRSPNSGADSWAAAAITTERFYSANLSEYPHSCNISMMIIRFFTPRYILKGSGWLGQHNNFSSLFRDKSSLLTWCLCKFCPFPAAWNSLMNLETSMNCCQSDAPPPYTDFVV